MSAEIIHFVRNPMDEAVYDRVGRDEGIAAAQ